MNLPTELLRTFIKAVDLGSFTRAGDAVGRTQSAVSLQMRRLEEMLDTQLVERGTHRVKLTEEGATLASYARRMLALNDEAVAGLARKTSNERFAWDSYRRFIQMYGDVVMGLKPVSKEEHDPFEVIIDMVKDKRGVKLDTDLDTDDLKELVQRFKALIRARIGRDFPVDPWEQLWGSVFAVFESWNNERARVYRELNDIPQSWGTAVNVQAMVFGNLGNTSATGVAFTRDAGTGEDLFNGELVGYALDAHMTQQLVMQALFRAVAAKRPGKGLLHHSDRGSQYCSQAYQKLLRQFGMQVSMSRKGNYWDNAPMESCWGSLKTELVHHRRFASREQAKREITEYIEIFYNRIRKQARLGHLSPAAFSQQYYAMQMAA